MDEPSSFWEGRDFKSPFVPFNFFLSIVTTNKKQEIVKFLQLFCYREIQRPSTLRKDQAKMTDNRQDKVRKLFESRAKAEAELQRLQEQNHDAVENNDMRVRVERLVTSCD